jgi:protein-L-isoaspartate(D-aspartate) O-methyltransferase|tara:strand:- start:497 stop:1156 length:660 start_codon:yes stop_codon:yes gene_type:complete
MNLNYQKARDLMVENQLRPNKIKDPKILNLFKGTKKEDFLPENIKELSYVDIDIDIEEKRGYLKNLHIAQLISNAKINKKDKILHLGGLTGYVSVILSKLCKELIVIEKNEKLYNELLKKIEILNLDNVRIVNKSFESGFKESAPFDIIFIDNPINLISDEVTKQINSNLGKMIIIKRQNKHLCKAYRITKNNESFTNEFLFDVFSKYELYESEKGFEF